MALTHSEQAILSEKPPMTERLYSFEMIRCPPGQPYLQLTMQASMGATPDPSAFFAAPHSTTVTAKNVTLQQALLMVGQATNTHFEKRGGMHVLLPGAPADAGTEAAKPYRPGPEADPLLNGDRITCRYGLTRNDLIDVVVRLLHDNVVVDPAVMTSGDCHLGLSVANGTFDELLAQLGLRAELRGPVVHILPLAGATMASKDGPPTEA